MPALAPWCAMPALGSRRMTAETKPAPAGVPPYFDHLFALLQQEDPDTVAAFGRHAHWGYWDDPATFDGSAGNYAEAAERLCRLVCDAAAIRDGLAVLDVGCGFGGTVASLNERFDRLDLVGVNIDARQLARAAREVKPRGANRIRFVCGDACKLPAAPARFDVVLAVECIFHFPDRARFFHEAAHALRPGGALTLCDFIPEEELLPLLEQPEFNPLFNESTKASYGRIDVQCSTEAYRKLGAAAGLSLAGEVDMTRNTLPTYRFLRNHMQGWDNAELSAHFDRATALLEKVSQKGFVRYKILTFRKP
jgi:SAM-dependent methyltransferase